MAKTRAAIVDSERTTSCARLRTLEQACVRVVKARFTAGSLRQLAHVADRTAERLRADGDGERAALAADLGRFARQVAESGARVGRREDRVIVGYLRALRS